MNIFVSSFLGLPVIASKNIEGELDPWGDIRVYDDHLMTAAMWSVDTRRWQSYDSNSVVEIDWSDLERGMMHHAISQVPEFVLLDALKGKRHELTESQLTLRRDALGELSRRTGLRWSDVKFNIDVCMTANLAGHRRCMSPASLELARAAWDNRGESWRSLDKLVQEWPDFAEVYNVVKGCSEPLGYPTFTQFIGWALS